MKQDFTFDGFEPANTTPVPDVLFDQLLPILNESELKVLLYIIRRTAGFKKPTDAISLTQFQKGIKKRATGEILDRGCGVKDRATIVKALASLETKRCIQSTKADDPAGDRATSAYRILFRSEVVGKTNHPVATGSGQNQPPWFAKPTTVVGNSDYGVVGDSNPQETVIQETTLQQTERQETDKEKVERDILAMAREGAFAQSPALFIRNEFGDVIEVPADLAEKALASQRKVLDLPEPTLPARSACLSQQIEKKLTHPRIEAVTKAMLSQRDESELEETVKRPAIRIASATQGGTPDAAVHAGNDRGAGVDSALPGHGPDSRGAAHPVRAPGLAAGEDRPAVAPSQTVRGALSSSDGAAPAHVPSAGVSPSLLASIASGPRASGARNNARTFTPPSRPHRQQANERPQLTLEGSQVKEWLQEIWGTTISMRSGNIKDLNDLGSLADVTRDALDATITYVEAKQWVKEHNVAISLRILSGNDERFRFLSFEDNWPAARKKKRASPEEDDQYSFAAILKRQEQQARA
jgi:hypothetical protein